MEVWNDNQLGLARVGLHYASAIIEYEIITNMADAEEEFSADAVQKFLLSNGGKATNVEVVGHFAKYLNDPEFKGNFS